MVQQGILVMSKAGLQAANKQILSALADLSDVGNYRDKDNRLTFDHDSRRRGSMLELTTGNGEDKELPEAASIADRATQPVAHPVTSVEPVNCRPCTETSGSGPQGSPPGAPGGNRPPDVCPKYVNATPSATCSPNSTKALSTEAPPGSPPDMHGCIAASSESILCPVCHKSTDNTSCIECSLCGLWCHQQCENLTDGQLHRAASPGFDYLCVTCKADKDSTQTFSNQGQTTQRTVIASPGPTRQASIQAHDTPPVVPNQASNAPGQHRLRINQTSLDISQPDTLADAAGVDSGTNRPNTRHSGCQPTNTINSSLTTETQKKELSTERRRLSIWQRKLDQKEQDLLNLPGKVATLTRVCETLEKDNKDLKDTARMLRLKLAASSDPMQVPRDAIQTTTPTGDHQGQHVPHQCPSQHGATHPCSGDNALQKLQFELVHERLKLLDERIQRSTYQPTAPCNGFHGGIATTTAPNAMSEILLKLQYIDTHVNHLHKSAIRPQHLSRIEERLHSLEARLCTSHDGTNITPSPAQVKQRTPVNSGRTIGATGLAQRASHPVSTPDIATRPIVQEAEKTSLDNTHKSQHHPATRREAPCSAGVQSTPNVRRRSVQQSIGNSPNIPFAGPRTFHTSKTTPLVKPRTNNGPQIAKPDSQHFLGRAWPSRGRRRSPKGKDRRSHPLTATTCTSQVTTCVGTNPIGSASRN